MLELRALAQDLGISQTEIGEIMGVGQSAVSFMMRGAMRIKEEHIEALIDKFGKETIDAYTVPDKPRRLRTQRTEAEVTIFQPDEVEEIKAEVVEDLQSVPINIYMEDMRKKDAEIYALNAEIRRQNERMDKLIEKLLER